MNRLKLILLALVFNLSGSLHAQVSVNVNIGSPPAWGPEGYNDVRYYYLPDVEAYYDVHTALFIYFGNGVWLHKTYLPWRYSHYDLYSGYKVVMYDYRGNTPYVHFKQHKIKYKKGYKGPAQKTIGKKHASKSNKQSSPQHHQQKNKQGASQSEHKQDHPQQKKAQSHKQQGGGKGKK